MPLRTSPERICIDIVKDHVKMSAVWPLKRLSSSDLILVHDIRSLEIVEQPFSTAAAKDFSAGACRSWICAALSYGPEVHVWILGVTHDLGR
jgi:hypothetical protein